MKIFAIWNSCGFEKEPLFYVEAKNVEDLKKILSERLKKGEPFGMFPGWSPVEISKEEMYKILNSFNEDDTDLVDEDKRESFNLFARMQSQTGNDVPILEELRKYKMYNLKYSVTLNKIKSLDIDKALQEKNMEKNNSHLAGEYFVASELYRRGYSVGMTIGNAKEIDILVEFDEGTTAKIQVKSIKNKGSNGWPIKTDQVRDDIVYVFVNLNINNKDDMSPPDCYILTANEAKSLIKDYSTRGILTLSSVKKGEHKDEWQKIRNASR